MLIDFITNKYDMTLSSNKYIDFNVMIDTSNKAIMFDTYEDAIESGLKYCLKSI